jgi:hypothetical protein
MSMLFKLRVSCQLTFLSYPSTIYPLAPTRFSARRGRAYRREHQHLGQRLPGAVLPYRRQRHHGSQQCRAHPIRGCGPARRPHHDQRSDRNQREAGRHRPGRWGGRRRRCGQIDTIAINATVRCGARRVRVGSQPRASMTAGWIFGSGEGIASLDVREFSTCTESLPVGVVRDNARSAQIQGGIYRLFGLDADRI